MLVLKPAPNFEAEAVVHGQFKQIKLSDYKGKYLVLVFYPLDFTFVCPTEIIAFNDRLKEFRDLNCEVAVVSVDSVNAHHAWTNMPRNKGGVGELAVPMVSDLTKTISAQYNVLLDTGFSTRGTFIICPEGIVRHYSVNEPPVGRSVDEVLRLLQAIQFTAKHGEVCPVNWKEGDRAMKPDPEASKIYFESTY